MKHEEDISVGYRDIRFQKLLIANIVKNFNCSAFTSGLRKGAANKKILGITDVSNLEKIALKKL